MQHLLDFTKRASIAVVIACIAVPTVALADIGDFAPGGNGPDGPGPGDWGGPDGFAQPEGGGCGGAAPSGSEGNSIVARRNNECANGNLVVDFDFDANGHPIASSFTRTCIPFR